MKLKYTQSSDKTESKQWNDFDPEAWHKFKVAFDIGEQPLQFIDIIPPNPEEKYNSFNYWKNKNDTVVFLFDTSKGINPLVMVNLVRDVYVDEFDYVEVGENLYAVRMWWD